MLSNEMVLLSPEACLYGRLTMFNWKNIGKQVNKCRTCGIRSSRTASSRFSFLIVEFGHIMIQWVFSVSRSNNNINNKYNRCISQKHIFFLYMYIYIYRLLEVFGPCQLSLSKNDHCNLTTHIVSMYGIFSYMKTIKFNHSCRYIYIFMVYIYTIHGSYGKNAPVFLPDLTGGPQKKPVQEKLVTMERLFPEGTLKERLRVSAGNERVPAMGFLLVESAGCLAILEFIGNL